MIEWGEDERTIQSIDNWFRFVLNYLTLFMVVGVLAYIIVKTNISNKLIKSVYAQLGFLFISQILFCIRSTARIIA